MALPACSGRSLSPSLRFDGRVLGWTSPGWVAGTFLGPRDDKPSATGLAPLQVGSRTFSRLPLNAQGDGAHQQWIGKALLLFLGLGCDLLNCLPLPQSLLSWPWLRTFPSPTEHRKVLNLVKGEGAENTWRFPASFAHLVSSLHLCRHSSQLLLSSILPFQFPTLAKPPALQGQPDSDITLILPQGGSWGGCPPTSAKSSFVLYRIILGGW